MIERGDTRATRALRPGEVRVTFLGTSSMLFDDGESKVMIDGFLSRPPLLRTTLLPIETRKDRVDAVLREIEASAVDAVFVAHSHLDHALDAAYVAHRTGATLYGSPSTLNVARGRNAAMAGERLPEARMHLFEPGEEVPIGDFHVTVVDSAHSPPLRFVNDDLGQEILEPLDQPARRRAYKEGGSYDFHLRHGAARENGGNTILVKAGANYADGKLEGFEADVLFLGISGLGKRSPEFRDEFYRQTVGVLRPTTVIPIHWDNFFRPLDKPLRALPVLVDRIGTGQDFLCARTFADGIEFRLLQSKASWILFSGDPPVIRPCPN